VSHDINRIPRHHDQHTQSVTMCSRQNGDAHANIMPMISPTASYPVIYAALPFFKEYLMSSVVSESYPATNIQASPSLSNATNVDPSEVDKFNKLAHEWWDNSGAFATLHHINPLRLNWIEDNIKRG